MVLTVHHLGVSQSERIVFLCEELGIPYNLTLHTRAPMFAPDSLKSLPGNATGKSPFIEDSHAGITLSESGAIVEYIIHRHGEGRLGKKPDDADYVNYLYWFHWANATLQPQMAAAMFPAPDETMRKFREARLHGALNVMEQRLAESKWLAGDDFSAADIMPVWSLTTQRYWGPVDLSSFPNILRWLQDVAARPGYQRAMEKGDPEMKPLLSGEAPATSLVQTGGVNSDVWKK
ncbi:hypothetical protein Q7P37_010813 [Cladosporium fusiforme]